MNLTQARKIYENLGQSESPTVTFRYFRVTDGPLVDRLMELFAERQAWLKVCEALQKELGATGVFSSRELAGFAFKNPPDESVWKRGIASGKEKMWVPRGNTKEGKSIRARMKKCGLNPNVQDALEKVDLYGVPTIMNGMHWYAPILWGSLDPSPLFFVKVPWQEYAPEVIEAYGIVRKNGCMSGTLDFLTDWKPHASMKPVKEWEALRETDERKTVRKAA